MAKELETLAKRHNVRILTFVNNYDELQYIEEYDNIDFVKIGTLSKIVNVFFHFRTPNLFAVRSSLRFTIKLIYIIKKYNIDAIHAEYTAMGQFYWIKKIFPNIILNLVEHDVVIQSYERLFDNSCGLRKIYYKWQKKLVNKKEKKYCKNFDNIIVLNNKDKKLLKSIYKVENVYTINPYYGIDFDSQSMTITKKIQNSICFIGLMNREENHEAAMRLIRIFKDINRDDYFLTIIGAYPREDLKKESTSNIRVTGFVDNIVHEILKNEIAVFPLEKGAGIKFKVLQAICLGLPTITTDVGAEGIDEDGNVLIISNSDEEIKYAIIKLLENKEIRIKTSNKSIEFVRNSFGWDESEVVFENLYE